LFWNRNKKNETTAQSDTMIELQSKSTIFKSETVIEYDPQLRADIEEFLEQKGFFIRQKVQGALIRTTNSGGWQIGPLGKLVRQNLLRWWMENISRLKNVVTLDEINNDRNLFRNYPVYAFQNSLQIPFGISRVKKVSREFFKSLDFIFTNEESRQFCLEFFVKPDTTSSWLDSWRSYLQNIFDKMGLLPQNLTCVYETPASLNQQYGTMFLERYNFKYKFPFGYEDVLQISNRTDFDFQTVSDINVAAGLKTKDEKGKDVFPHLIEIKLDVEKMVLALILNRFTCASYENKKNTSIVFSPLISPIKCVVFAAVNDVEVHQKAVDLHTLLNAKFKSVLEDLGEIGKTVNHYRQFGVPYIIMANAESVKTNSFQLFDCETEEWQQLTSEAVYQYVQNGVGI